MTKSKNQNVRIILVALVLTIIIYAAGLYTGIAFSKRIEQKTTVDIQQLQSNLSKVQDELQVMQFTESFVNNVQGGSCNAPDVLESVGLNEELSRFWNLLPYRLEAYESSNPLTPDYVELKESYMFISLRAWVIMKGIYNNCEDSPVPVLYFYSKTCDTCVEQGQILDSAAASARENGIELRIFTIDYDSSIPPVDLVKSYYSVDSVPAIIVGDTKLSGDIISEDEIVAEIIN